ncbi:MAG: DUF308 domain-containing protein [Gammaproteobacteria bacterium]|nr:DUF308 domain-containing protein [Gammaproteobacteria bacterium]
MPVSERTTGLPRSLYRHPNRMFGVGVLFVVLGALAIALPVATSIGIELALGALLVVAGAAQLAGAIYAEDGWGIAANVALGALLLVLGLLFLLNPLEGILTLTLLVAALFFAAAAIKLGTAWRMRGVMGWLWGVVSGLVSLAVGILIAAGWPAISAWVLGLLFGIDLVFSGIMLIAAAVAGRASTAI